MGEEGSDYFPVHASYRCVIASLHNKLSMLESAEKNIKSRLGPYFTLSSNCLL